MSSPWTSSSDGKVSVVVDEAHAGVLVKVTAAASSAEVWRTEMSTGTRVLVRSGAPVTVIAGVGYAYDHEASPGVDYEYSVIVAGVQSTPVAAYIPWSGECGAWLKSVTDPSLSRRVDLAGWEYGWDARDDYLDVPMSPWPFAVGGVASGDAGSGSILTEDRAQWEGVHTLLRDGGTLLLQGPSSHGLDPMWIRARGARDVRRGNLPGWELREIPFTWVELDRPVPDFEPVRMPRWSWQDATKGMSWAQVDAAYPTFESMLLAGVGA